MSARKGSILDIPMIVIVLFAFAFTILIGSVILSEFRSTNTNNALGMDDTIIMGGVNALSSLDYMFVFATFGLGIATVILAFFIRTHPIMFFFLLILTAIFVIITVFFTNAFVMIGENEKMAATAANFPLIDAVMKNLPLIITIIAFILMMALFVGKRPDVGM